MPPPVQSITSSAINNVAIAGTEQALTRVIPDAFFRAFNRVFHGETTLRGTEDTEIFDALRAELSPICCPNGNDILPAQVIECWKVFAFEVSKGPVYTFNGVPDLQKCKGHYETYTPIEGRVRHDFPLTGAVLGILSAVKSIEKDAKQNIAKIALGYIGLVSLALTELDGPVQQYEVITLLKKVTSILINSERYRNCFDSAAQSGLTEIFDRFNKFLNITNAVRDCEILPRAMKRFQVYQLGIVCKLFRTLLVLTEGGNKRSLTTDMDRIIKGLLEDGRATTTFDIDNPFQKLLRYTATSLNALYTQYDRQPITAYISIPTLKEIENYLIKSLSKGNLVGNNRYMHGCDAVLYLLEQKPRDEGASEAVWASAKDKEVTNASAKHLMRIADWLRFHLYIADKVVDINAILSVEGQSWIAHGEEANIMRHFMKRYDEMLKVFQQEIEQIHKYLIGSIRNNMGAEHGVMQMLGVGLGQNVTSLVEHGLSPLLKIDDRFIKMVNSVIEIRRRTFNEVAGFFNGSGYNFTLSYTREADVSAHTSTPVIQGGGNSSAQVLQAKQQKDQQDAIEVQKIADIKVLLIEYAKTHEYIAKDAIEPFEFIGNGVAIHETRSAWIQKILVILNSSNGDILGKVLKEITKLKHSKSWSHFKCGLGQTEIQKCIEAIEEILCREEENDNALPNAFKESSAAEEENSEMQAVIAKDDLASLSAASTVEAHCSALSALESASTDAAQKTVLVTNLPTNEARNNVVFTRRSGGAPNFVIYLEKSIIQLSVEGASQDERKGFISILERLIGLDGRLKELAILHSRELRSWRYQQAKEALEHTLAAALITTPESKETAQHFLLKMQADKSIVRKVSQIPSDLSAYHGEYLFLTRTKQLFYIHNEAIDTKIKDVARIAEYLEQHSAITVNTDELISAIESGGEQNPMQAVVKAQSSPEKTSKAYEDYDTKRSALLMPCFGRDSWVISHSSRQYQLLNEQVGRLLTSAGVVDESNMTPEEFLNAVQRHLLLNLSEREEAFQEESLALDALLTRIMQEFSSISTEEPREEESKARFYKEQQRRDFYQAVIPNLMALGANPIHWMHQERQGTKTARVEATSSRGYLLAAQQVELILSNMEHRASFLGGTVLVLGEKFKRLMLATEEFAKHLYACAGDEHEWLWNKLGRFFDITDGARLERATVFWSVLELLYTMLDNGFSVEEAYMVRETSESTTIQLKTQTFQERQKLFREAATAYVRRMQSNASDEPCELSKISEKELKLGKLAYRNYGRKTFLELLNAYLSIEGEFERLAEIRQCSENIFNAAGAVAASKRQVEEANRRTEEERRQKEEERRQKEEERRQKEEERRQKEEANKRAEDGERSGAIFALLKSHLPVSYFHGILPKEKEARYRSGYQAVLQILREINPKEPEEKLKACIFSQIRDSDAHAHLREFIVPVTTSPQVMPSQRRFTLYATPTAASQETRDMALSGSQRMAQ